MLFDYDDRFGLKKTETDPNGITTNRTYDELGRVTHQDEADGDYSDTVYSTSTTYGSAYKAVTTDISKPDTTVYWDSLNREVAKSVVGGGGATRVAETRYLNNGLIEKTRDPGAVLWTQFTYDWLQRPLTTSHPSGLNTSYAYSGTTTGLTTAVTESGHVKITTKNSRGQITRIDTDLSAYLTFQYDGNGYPTQANASGVVTTAVFDDRGFKTSMNDADMGAWSYQYDPAGNITQQQDAAGNTTTMAYDVLNRMTSRTVGGQTSTWTYDGTGTGNKLGKLNLAQGPGGFRKAYYYDSLARPYLELSQVDGKYYYSYTAFGSYSRVARVDHFWRPLGLEGSNFVGHTKWNSFGMLYSYNADGYVTKLTDDQARDWWKLPTYDALDKLTGYTYGNGIATTEAHDPSTGDLLTTQSSVQGLTYTYDVFGNLTQRVDAKRSLTDNYTYDALNRLTVSSGTSMTYDPLGNITTKGGLGLSYGGTRPHAVTSAGGLTYTYDANGNLTGRGTSTVSWTAFNQPLQLQTGGTTSTFAYNDSFGRVMETNVTGGVTSKKYYIAGGFEQFVNAGSVETRIYVTAPSGTVGVRALLERDAGVATPTGDRTAAREEIEYYHKDHLGSNTVVTNASGQPIQQYTFESWGMRTPYGTATGGEFALMTDRGFTGHEMLDAHALVHMNGRIYDPLLGRMLSADPTVKNGENPQNYNRYTYVLNNPLTLVDPSGFADEDPNQTGMVTTVTDFTIGVGAGWVEDNNPFAEEVVPYSNANKLGIFVGHALALFQAMKEIEGGGTAVAGSGALETVSGGAATPVAVPVALGGTVLGAHGSWVGYRSIRNMLKMDMTGSPDGGTASSKSTSQIAKKGLPTSGETPFKPKYSVNKAGEKILQRAEVKHGPKSGKLGFVDERGRIWIRDEAHSGYPTHWDVQVDGGRSYFRVGLDGNNVIPVK